MIAPRGGHYPISIVSLSLRLVLQAGASLRGAAAALVLFVEQGFASFAVPCFSTIRSWLLRVGCYALSPGLARTLGKLGDLGTCAMVDVGVQRSLCNFQSSGSRRTSHGKDFAQRLR
jgi:hypothetical protein